MRVHSSGYRKIHHHTDLHLARKAWHFVTGLTIATVYTHWVSREAAVAILAGFLGFFLMGEVVRLRFRSVNAIAVRLWGPLMRTNELRRWSGTVYYLAATLLAIAVFPKPIAVLSILYLACGDPVASLVGIIYGDRGPRFRNGKSLIGTAAGSLICIAVTLVFLSAYPVPFSTLLALCLLGGIAGGVAELLPLDVNDNFSIPLVSGFVLWLAFILLGL